MPPPTACSTPFANNNTTSLSLNLNSKTRKLFKGQNIDGGLLTPPTSSGAEDSAFPFHSNPTDIRALRQALNKARLHSKSIFNKLEFGLEVVSLKI